MMRVRRYVKYHEIELYHAHLTYGVVFGALIGIPRVYTHHSVKMRLSRAAFLLILPLIDRLVAVSSDCAKTLSEFSTREVTTIRNAVDARKLLPRALGPGQLDKEVRCISVGRICEDKNYPLLVRAVALLPADIRCRLVVQIAGEGSTVGTADLRAKIVEQNVDGTIHLLGNRSDIPTLLSDSHLFLMSSACEGMPIALLEAALSGLPCVVTDVGGCREVIETCQNGAVVEPGDAQALAEAIGRVASDTGLLSHFSSNALRLSSVFSIGHAGADHITMYNSLLRIHGSAKLN
jgi:glycosyltransferase involved in cell wall biosynthesis